MLRSFPKITCSWICLFLIVLTGQKAVAQYGDVVPPPAELKTGFDSITPEQASQWLNILAGPTFAGRGTGQPGYTMAAHWVAGKLAEFGLEPIGDNGTYFQLMPLTRRSVDMSSCKITGPDGLEISGEGNLGFSRFTDDVAVEGDVVFLNLAGEELALPEGIDLRDKIVFFSTDETASRRAARFLAESRPAAAIRIVEGTPTTAPQTLFPGRRSRSTSVSGTISVTAAAELAMGLGAADGWNDTSKTSAVDTGKKIEVQMRFREEQKGRRMSLHGWKVPTRNCEMSML